MMPSAPFLLRTDAILRCGTASNDAIVLQAEYEADRPNLSYSAAAISTSIAVENLPGKVQLQPNSCRSP